MTVHDAINRATEDRREAIDERNNAATGRPRMPLMGPALAAIDAIAEMAPALAAMHALFEQLLVAGFTEDQALKYLAFMMAAATGGTSTGGAAPS